MSVLEKPIVFSNGAEQLLGIAHLPQPASVGVVIVVGGPQYRVGSHRQFVLTARALADAGYAVLRFDYRGMGDSSGAMPGFDRVDSDIKAAIDALLRAAPGLKSIVLWGLCDAASACLIYARQSDERVRGMILANPWVRTVASEASARLKHYYFQRLMQRSFWSKLLSGGLQLRSSIAALFGTMRSAGKASGAQVGGATQDFRESMLRGAQNSRCPVLMLISEQDLTAAEFTALHGGSREWQGALSDRATFVHLAGADHTFSNGDGLQVANAKSVDWLRANF